MDQFEIRQTTSADENGLRRLYLEAFSGLLKLSYSQDFLDAALPKLTRVDANLIQSGKYYLAENTGGKILGAGGWSCEAPGSGEFVKGQIHLRHFAVSPEASRKGIGRAIFNRCIADAGQISRIECFSTLNAKSFYNSLGLKVVSEFEVPMGNGIVFPSLRMVSEH